MAGSDLVVDAKDLLWIPGGDYQVGSKYTHPRWRAVLKSSIAFAHFFEAINALPLGFLRRWKVGLPEEENWRNVVPVSHEHGNCELPEGGFIVDDQLPYLLGMHAGVKRPS